MNPEKILLVVFFFFFIKHSKRSSDSFYVLEIAFTQEQDYFMLFLELFWIITSLFARKEEITFSRKAKHLIYFENCINLKFITHRMSD